MVENWVASASNSKYTGKTVTPVFSTSVFSGEYHAGAHSVVERILCSRGLCAPARDCNGYLVHIESGVSST